MAGETSRRVEVDLEIYTFDIDFAGHVSNITYLRWLEIGRLRWLAEAGLPIQELMRRDLAPVLTSTEVSYRVALRLGDPVHLSMEVAELRAASATLDFEISSRDRVAATAHQRGLFISAATGRPRRITADMRARLLPFVRPAGTPPRILEPVAPDPEPDADEVMTPGQVAALLHLDEATVLARAAAGDLPGRRFGMQWRFSRRAVLTWLEGSDGERPGPGFTSRR